MDIVKFIVRKIFEIIVTMTKNTDWKELLWNWPVMGYLGFLLIVFIANIIRTYKIEMRKQEQYWASVYDEARKNNSNRPANS